MRLTVRRINIIKRAGRFRPARKGAYLNDYEARKQARIDRYHEKADKARAESADYSRQADDMASAIPFGQPVHGAADRRYRDKIGKKMDKAITADQKAAYYDRKAEAAEKNTAISSDDPEAVAKLTAKLENLKADHERMKQINAYYRKHGTCKGCPDLSDEMAAKMDDRIAPWDKSPYPAWALQNSNQEIHRIEKRIQELTDKQEVGYTGWKFDGGEVVADADMNRLQIFFESIPPEEVRQELKGRGFRWARSVGAWQRQLTKNAIWSASRIAATRPIDGTDPTDIQPKRPAKSGPEH